MAHGKTDDDHDGENENIGDPSGIDNSQIVQADSNSVATGDTRIEGDLSGQFIVGNNNVTLLNSQLYIIGRRSALEPPPYRRRPFPVKFIPRDFPFLLDRTRQLERTKNAIQTSLSVSVFGERGIGKTSFLRHVIHRTGRSAFSSGVVLLNVSGRGFDDLLQFLFEQFFDSPLGCKATDAQIRHEFQELNALFFLDDLELGIDKITSLQDYAPGCIFVLASVEQSLWEDGKAISLKRLQDEDAVTLFEHEFARVNEDRSLNEEEQAAARKLCRLYQGHPWLTVFAACLVAQGKISIFQLLEEPAQVDAQKAVLQAALTTLTEYQGRVLAILAAVGGLKLAEDHLIFLSEDADSSKTLHGLLVLRMIDGKNGIYSLAGNLASFLAEELDLSKWEDRLLDHFTQWLEKKPAQARIEESMEALLYLLKKASKKEQWSRVIRFGQALEPGLILGKRWGAWAELLHQIMTAAKALGDKSVEAWVLHQLGSRAMCLGQDDEARRLFTLALHLRKEIHDQEGLQVTQHNLDVLRPIPVPPNSPRVPPPRNLVPYLPWLAGGSALAATALLILIWFIGRGVPYAPGITDTSTAIITLTLSASSIPSRTSTTTPTPSVTPTRTLTQTPALREPVVLQPAPCSSGPSPVDVVISGIGTGTPAPLYSQASIPGWVVVVNPRYSKPNTPYPCWFELKYLQIDPAFDMASLPISTPPYTILDSFDVPVNGTPVLSNEKLDKDVIYKIRVWGTFSDGNRLADAEYTDFSNIPSSAQNECEIPSGSVIPPSIVDLGIGIVDPVNVQNGSYGWGKFNEAHEYIRDLPGQGTAILVYYKDCYAGDNSGLLRIEIYEPTRN